MIKNTSNPKLVKELISNLWNKDYSQERFEKNYNSLNAHDMSIVADAIDSMEETLLNSEND